MGNEFEKSSDQLAIELFELKEHEQQPYLTDKRREMVRHEIAIRAFELSCRQPLEEAS